MISSRNRAHLLIVDCQERLVPHVANHAQVIANAVLLTTSASRLGVPVTFAEHYPKGLGRTVGALTAAAGPRAVCLEKIEFSCWRNEGLKARFTELRRAGRREVVVAGMEAHVCVLQTVLDLVAADFEVFLVADALSSRRLEDCDFAVSRARWDGAAIVTVEMIVFEWLERAGTPEFEALLGLFKSGPAA